MADIASVSISEWTLNIGHLSLSGLQSGEDKPAKVIALHGFLDNANSTICLAQSFKDFHYIAIDMAGHGGSDHRPTGSHYNLLDYVQDLHALVTKLNVARVGLVGHSLGGIIASLYAGLYPEKVDWLVSIDAFGPLTQPTETTAKQLRSALDSRVKKMLRTKPKPADLILAAKARASTTDLSYQWCHKILERNITTASSEEMIWRSDPRLRTRSYLRLTEEQACDIMQNITCPLLVIAASNSFKQLPELVRARQHWIPQAELKVISGGHHIHLEQTEQVINQIGNFVNTWLCSSYDQ